MEEVVTVASFSEPLEAEMARGRLQSAGIDVFLAGENARILEPGLAPLRLQVAAQDAEDARAILADAGEDCRSRHRCRHPTERTALAMR